MSGAAGVYRLRIDEVGAAVKRYEVQDVLITDPSKRISAAMWSVDGATARLTNGDRPVSPFPIRAPNL